MHRTFPATHVHSAAAIVTGELFSKVIYKRKHNYLHVTLKSLCHCYKRTPDMRGHSRLTVQAIVDMEKVQPFWFIKLTELRERE